jgi:hypothetical protein
MQLISTSMSRWRIIDWMKQEPLAWALPIQALLLFSCLNLLDPWGDEWFTLAVAPQPLNQIRYIAQMSDHNPPLYFFALHFWIHLPWPSSLLLKMRAMSCFWALLATMIFYRGWLRTEPLRIRWMFLALWVLSPCLLLYARMARSYSMQLALALLTIYAAVEWVKKPQSTLWLLAFSGCAAILLYTHYLPGLAIMMAVGFVLVLKPYHFAPVRVFTLGASILIIALFYLPWLTPLRGAIADWESSTPYRVGNLFIDHLVRIAYWFVSFTFGEIISTPGIVLATVLTPVSLYALCRAVRLWPEWLSLVVATSVLGYVGVSQWTGFPFTASRMLFALPFFILLLVKGIDASYRHSSMIFAGLLVVYVLADYSYFVKSGFLNKAYCVPYEEMAAVIRNGSPTAGAVLFLDEYNSFPDPLLYRLRREVLVIPVDEGNAAQKEVEALRGKPTVIWFWRHTHDISPAGIETRLEKELSQNRTVQQYDYLPYSQPERWVLSILRGPGQPSYSYRLTEMR